MNQTPSITTDDLSSKDALLLSLTGSIVSAQLSRDNLMPSDEVPAFIVRIHTALSRLGEETPEKPVPAQIPAVDPRKSIQDEFIICLEDGKRFKSLKRHLWTYYKLTPDDYRAKWGLPASYPMVAPNYAVARSLLAKKMGLGRHREREAQA